VNEIIIELLIDLGQELQHGLGLDAGILPAFSINASSSRANPFRLFLFGDECYALFDGLSKNFDVDRFYAQVDEVIWVNTNQDIPIPHVQIVSQHCRVVIVCTVMSDS
jgi:hypothetical protein